MPSTTPTGGGPDPGQVADETALRGAVAALLSTRRDIRAVALDTGVSKTTVAELRGLRRRVTWETLERLVRRYAPDRLEDWREAWRRVQPGGTPEGNGAGVPTPRELPPDVPGFVGRGAEQAELDRLAWRARVPVLAITGTAGVGKTALALRWAHRHQDRFPDGCVYLDLHGYDRSDPLEPAAALFTVLRRLGVEPAGFPADADGRAARYRTQLADRRMLLVLDNVHDSEQVRLLLPGSSAALVLLTSRDGLTDLRDRYGARRLDLDPLPPGDAVRLLSGLLPSAAKDPAGLGPLADRCARLPLALRVAAGTVDDRMGLTPADLAGQLAADAHGTPGVAALDGTLGAVFASSCRYLDEPALRAFRLLGGWSGDAIAPAEFAVLTGADALEPLLRARLLQEVAPGRYGMHDLLRRYARDRGRREDPPAVRRAADARLLDHYALRAAAADDLLHPGRPRPARWRPSPAPEPFASREDALAWLDAERSNLVRYVALAARDGWPSHAVRLADNLWTYLFRGGHHVDAAAVHENAATAARTLGSGRYEADALERLALALQHLGRYGEAERAIATALELNRRLGDRADEGATLGQLGTLHARLGRNPEALLHLREHLRIVQEAGDRAGEGQVLNNIGLVQLRWGRYQDAAADLATAVEVAHEAGSRNVETISRNNLALALQRLGRTDDALAQLARAADLAASLDSRGLQGQVLDTLGVTYARRGELDRARELLLEALDRHRENGEPASEAETLDNLGEVLRRLGRASDALDRHVAALRIAVELGERGRAASAHNGAGLARHYLGNFAGARAEHERALRLAIEIGNLDEQARALTGLAAIDDAVGNDVQASTLRHHAVSLYTQLGLPDAHSE